MTCASCVARVEKRLRRVPGATPTVNLATNSAHITFAGEANEQVVAALLAAVAGAGFQASPLPPATATSRGQLADEDNAASHWARRLPVAVALTVPVAALSMIPYLQFPGWQWSVAALALPVAIWCAAPFHLAAFRALKHGSATMDTLISLGVIAATGWSLWALGWGGAGAIGMRMHVTLLPAAHHSLTPELYFEVACVVTTFLLTGRNAEQHARRRAGSALRSLLQLGARDVRVRRLDQAGNVHHSQIPIAALAVGDEFEVRPGEKIATDGIVIGGSSAIDESLLTGEPLPRAVTAGSEVTGATINTSGHLCVRATRIGQDTVLAGIGRLVSAAQSGKAPIQRLADRVSAVFVPVVILLAIATGVTWFLLRHDGAAALTAAVAVLIIACPCALGLATPTGLLVGSGRGFELGILLRGPQVLESTRRIDTVVFDKTGTLTAGTMQVVAVVSQAPTTHTLALLGAVESLSEHPLAAAITTYVRSQVSDPLAAATEFHNWPGQGVRARVPVPAVRSTPESASTSTLVSVGSLDWLAQEQLQLPPKLAAATQNTSTQGATVVGVGWDGQVQGLVFVRDDPKPDAAAAVAALRELGLRPVLLTGDASGAAQAIAGACGITEVIAGVLPAGKVAAVKELQDRGAVVAMVGDGINDAAALVTADLGMAMASGTDVAIQAADITLMRSDVSSVARAIRLSRTTLRVIKQNLFWAFAYNVLALPLAAFGLLNPMIAGATMAASSVLVVSNSLRLRGFDRSHH